MNSLNEKYDNHPLFRHCISVSVPPGWKQLIVDLVDWLTDYNTKNKTAKPTTRTPKPTIPKAKPTTQKNDETLNDPR